MNAAPRPSNRFDSKTAGLPLHAMMAVAGRPAPSARFSDRKRARKQRAPLPFVEKSVTTRKELPKGTVPFSSNENWDSPRSPVLNRPSAAARQA